MCCAACHETFNRRAGTPSTCKPNQRSAWHRRHHLCSAASTAGRQMHDQSARWFARPSSRVNIRWTGRQISRRDRLVIDLLRTEPEGLQAPPATGLGIRSSHARRLAPLTRRDRAAPSRRDAASSLTELADYSASSTTGKSKRSHSPSKKATAAPLIPCSVNSP